ncbi:MAG: helix-turn-helix domain-containing protein, partial [Candidatus Bathyarchaeia archaeon]|nr:helix-turn-helix domain-containing protein [Candidatus Bathyarchaeia archaeon]
YESLATKELGELAKTSRPDAYRVLAKLQKKGLIEKIITKPAKFKAIPMETGVGFLLERKKVEHKNLETKSNLLLQAIRERPAPKPSEVIASHFALIPQREPVVKKINEAIGNAKKSVDIFLSWKRFSLGITSTFANSSQKAWERGVKFRIVVENPEETTDVELARQFCRKSPFCEIRFLYRPPKTVLGIYDQKHFFVIVDPKKGLFDSPALWSNSQSLLSVIQDYFEMLWLTAKAEPSNSRSIRTHKT